MPLIKLFLALFILFPTLSVAQEEEDWKLTDFSNGQGWQATNRFGAFEVSLQYRPNLSHNWFLVLDHPEPIGVAPNEIAGITGSPAINMFGKQHQRYPDWFTTVLIASPNMEPTL